MSEALRKAGKYFDLFVYPQKSHGMDGPARFHLNEAVVNFFDRNL